MMTNRIVVEPPNDVGMGFRLAHDGVAQLRRGRAWFFDYPLPSLVSRSRHNPGNFHDHLGFRLVQERT